MTDDIQAWIGREALTVGLTTYVSSEPPAMIESRFSWCRALASICSLMAVELFDLAPAFAQTGMPATGQTIVRAEGLPTAQGCKTRVWHHERSAGPLDWTGKCTPGTMISGHGTLTIRIICGNGTQCLTRSLTATFIDGVPHGHAIMVGGGMTNYTTALNYVMGCLPDRYKPGALADGCLPHRAAAAPIPAAKTPPLAAAQALPAAAAKVTPAPSAAAPARPDPVQQRAAAEARMKVDPWAPNAGTPRPEKKADEKRRQVPAGSQSHCIKYEMLHRDRVVDIQYYSYRNGCPVELTVCDQITGGRWECTYVKANATERSWNKEQFVRQYGGKFFACDQKLNGKSVHFDKERQFCYYWQ